MSKKVYKEDNKIRIKLLGRDYTDNIDFVKSLPHVEFNSIYNVFETPIRSGIIKKLIAKGFSVPFELVNEIVEDGGHKNIEIPRSLSPMFTKKEFAWQREAMQFLKYHNNRALICASPGMGKTPMSLKYCEWQNLFPLLVICQNNVKYNWKEKVEEWIPGKSIFVMEGETSFCKYTEYDVVIVNYDLFPSQVKKTSKGYVKSIELGEFAKSNFAACIIDEVQSLKSDDASTFHGIEFAVRSIMAVIGLSGTPIENRAKEFFNILTILRPDIFKVRSHYLERYCDPKKVRFGNKRFWTFNGLTNWQELNVILTKNIMFRTIKESKVEQAITEISIDKKAYDEVYKEFKKEVREGKRSGSSLAKFEVLRQTVWKLKKEACLLQIDALIREYGKILVFAVNKAVISDIMEYYGNTALKIDGDLNSKEKLEVVKEFQRSDNVKVVALNTDAGATGVDGLQHVCHAMVQIQLPWHREKMEQIEGRLDRGGQKADKVYNFLFVALDTIDTDMLKLMDKKMKDVEMVVDGNEKPTKTFFAELLKKKG